MSKSLAEALPEQQARCRELLAIYKEIGPPGQFAAMMIEAALRRADRAAARQDVVAMIAAYKELEEFKS